MKRKIVESTSGTILERCRDRVNFLYICECGPRHREVSLQQRPDSSATARMVLSKFMPASPQFMTAGYGIAAVAAWGTSDFLGGYATRRANAFLFTAVFNLGGLVLVGTLAGISHAPLLPLRSTFWVLSGGILGSAGVAVFFQALSTGKMGLVAPVAAVLSAAIPAIISALTEGFPGKIPILGFSLAAIGLWLITRAEDSNGTKNIGLAIVAGIGFAGFYLCVRKAGGGPAFWFATITRTGGLLVTGLIVFLQRSFRDITPSGLRLAVIAGSIDSFGTIFFVHASQSGRLDEAVVISSLYPAVTVLLARIVLKEHFTRWRFVGLLAALAAVPMIAAQ
jgi:drug/metabolite transporter (DMT)-like permease